METPRYADNREIILDAIIFLIIVTDAIYTIKKRKKDNDGKGENYIENRSGANEEKGLIIEEIQENIKKYKDGKQFIKAFFTIPILIICPPLLGFCLYELITNKPDADTPFSLMIFLMILLSYIVIFKNSKKTLNKFKNNLLYKMIRLYIVIFIALIIAAIGRISGPIICQALELNTGLSALITIFFGLSSMILGVYFITKYNGLTSKDSPKKHGDNNYINNEPINYETTDTEQIDTEQTYDEIIDNNKKLEEKTGFHQGSLIK